MAATHPLLDFPDNHIIQKLREMSIEEVLKFSLISEKCKNLVSSAQIQGTSITITIENYITIKIATSSGRMLLSYYREPDMYWGIGAYGRKKKLTAPQSVWVLVMTRGGFHERDLEWTRRDFTMKDWLNHLQYIFHQQKIDRISFHDHSSDFDIDDVKEVFGSIAKVYVHDTRNSDFNQKVFEKFFPIRKLHIGNGAFENSIIPRNILMQNFNALQIGEHQRDETLIMTLDDLLIINSKRIYVSSLQITPKQTNKFIKLWMKGSNPHMERLYIFYSDIEDDDDEVIMRGIKHEVIPGEGVDIYRMNGTKARIKIETESRAFPQFEMYINKDHLV